LAVPPGALEFGRGTAARDAHDQGIPAGAVVESLVELEGLLVSKPDRPGRSRRLFDRLWTTWCTRAYRTEPEWAYQTAEKAGK
jgi:hypothetical protein